MAEPTIDRSVVELTDAARGATDATGYFPALYARVTADIAAGIAAGRFTDGPRMERLAVTFAGYYRRRSGEPPVPRCWQAAADVAGDPDLVVVQHLLLAINAHVNHDLAQAVVDVAPAAGGLAAVRGDFDAINDVLAGTFDTVIDDLDRVARWTSEAALLGGGRAFNFSLRAAHAQAWQAAERLDGLGPDGRRAYVAELDRLVTVVAYLVARPACPVRLAAWLARRLEERDHRGRSRAPCSAPRLALRAAAGHGTAGARPLGRVLGLGRRAGQAEGLVGDHRDVLGAEPVEEQGTGARQQPDARQVRRVQRQPVAQAGHEHRRHLAPQCLVDQPEGEAVVDAGRHLVDGVEGGGGHQHGVAQRLERRVVGPRNCVRSTWPEVLARRLASIQSRAAGVVTTQTSQPRPCICTMRRSESRTGGAAHTTR